MQLRRVNPSLIRAISRNPNRVENNKVMPFMVERIIEFAEALLEQLLSIKRVILSDPARRIDPADIVVADRVIKLQPQVLLGLVVEVEQRQRTLLRHTQRIEHMVAPIDRKVGLQRTRLLERHIRADDPVQLRLQMGIRQKEKRKRLLRMTWCRRGRRQKRGKAIVRNGSGEAGSPKESEKLPAAGSVHASMITPTISNQAGAHSLP